MQAIRTEEGVNTWKGGGRGGTLRVLGSKWMAHLESKLERTLIKPNPPDP